MQIMYFLQKLYNGKKVKTNNSSEDTLNKLSASYLSRVFTKLEHPKSTVLQKKETETQCITSRNNPVMKTS